jgi:hypothetical protein
VLEKHSSACRNTDGRQLTTNITVHQNEDATRRGLRKKTVVFYRLGGSSVPQRPRTHPRGNGGEAGNFHNEHGVIAGSSYFGQQWFRGWLFPGR